MLVFVFLDVTEKLKMNKKNLAKQKVTVGMCEMSGNANRRKSDEKKNISPLTTINIQQILGLVAIMIPARAHTHTQTQTHVVAKIEHESVFKRNKYTLHTFNVCRIHVSCTDFTTFASRVANSVCTKILYPG